MKISASQWCDFALVKIAVSIVLLLAVYTGLQNVVLAQSAATGGQIVGQVMDASNASIGGAEITVRNQNTNYTRTNVTNDSGSYIIPGLPVGPYEVIIKVEGFATQSQEVIVTLGSSINVSFSLTVAQSTAIVEVNGSNSSELNLEPGRSSAQSTINDIQIKGLPANGRRFQDFVSLTPAISVEPLRNGLSVSGQRGINTNINIDGADYNQPFFGGIRGGERSGFAPTLSQEAVQEFQVARNTFSAEFGRSTGGVINVITKSGTNQFHGSAFYNIRDESLTAEDAFNRASLARQQQFGGAIGGPIVKNRTFFFTALDFQKVSQPFNVLFSNLDTLNKRNTPGGLALVGVAPEQPFSATNDAQTVLGRIDHQLFTNNNLSTRFNFSRNNGKNATNTGNAIQPTTNTAVSNNGTEMDRTYTFVSQLTSVLSSKMLNELRFQFAREDRPRKNNAPGPEVTVRENGTTVGVYGQRSFLPVQQFDDRYQITNNLSVIAGKHNFKFGFDFNRAFVDQIFRSNAGGVYSFNSLDDFANRKPAQFSQFIGTGAFQASQKELAFYLQDEWRPITGLTISPGFRYEAVFNPDYLTPTAIKSRVPQATNIPDDKSEYGPRLGVAWDIGNKGRTVMRFGGGRFYARTPLILFNQAITGNGGNPETGFSITLNGGDIASNFNKVGVNLSQASVGSLPIFTSAQLNQLFTGPTGALSVSFFDPEFRNPSSTQFNIALDQQIARGIVAGIDFSYINTSHLERLIDLNLGAPVKDATGRNVYPTARPNPNFSTIRAIQSSARSLYRALTLSLNVRKPKYVIDVYYTLSTNYSDDDNERNATSILYSDPQNLKNEYNYSNLDQRHMLTFNGVYSLPFGIDIAGTGRFSSGTPFSALAGADLNNDRQFPAQDRPILNGVEFKRNSFRNFATYDVSLKLQKGFKLPNERGKFSLSLEMFNAFKFDNVRIDATGNSAVFGPGTKVVNGMVVVQPISPSFGLIRDAKGNFLKNNLAGAPFQVQLGARYTF